MDWKQLLAYITGSVDQEFLLRLWDMPSQCTPEDVETLLQAINQGKRPVRFAGDL